jgi:two-component system NtrC family sensor kinase
MSTSSSKAWLSFAAAPLAALGLWLLIALATAANAWREREMQLTEVELGAKAATALLQAHTANIFQAVTTALEETAKTLGRDDVPRHDRGLRDSMRQRLPAMPYVRALYVIGPNGYILHDTDYPTTPDVSLADREYFRAHEASDSPDIAVSAPIQSRSGAGWFVAVSRRIDRGGQFAGVAVAAIQLRYFSGLYERVGLGQGAMIFLFHRNGRLLAQYPGEVAQVGQSFAEAPLFRTHLPAAAAGVYRSEGEPLPYPRVISYASIPGQPLVVGVAQNIDVRLQAWRRAALGTAVGLLLLLAALMFAGIQTSRFLRQRRRMRYRLQQAEKMEALGLLTGGIAHDFGNMLNIVAMNLPLVQRRCEGDDPAQAALGRVQWAVDNGAQLIRQLMSFSRSRDLDIVEGDMNEVLRACLPLLTQAAGNGVTVSFEPAAQLDRCRLDRAHLETALINLVVNARDAMEGEGRIVVKTKNIVRKDEVRLRWRGRAGTRFVCVTVQDNGPGMTSAVRRRALEPFFTTKGEQGTGLGLAQVYGHLRQIGGDVGLESKVGVGTSVHLYFPAAASGPAP